MEYRNILVPLDFSDLSKVSLHSAASIAELSGGKITPFHTYLPVSEMNGPYTFGMVSTPAEDYDQMEKVIGERLREVSQEEVDPSLLNEPVVSVGNPARAIVTASEEYDLIVMTTHGRTGFSRFFLGSVSEKVLRMTEKPVLVVNRDRELKNLDRIMVTTDFSDNSRMAFRHALHIARKTGGELELVHIMTYDRQHESRPDEHTVSLGEQRLDEMAGEEFRDLGDQFTTKVIVSPNTAHEAILEYNLEHPHDLIVISTVGRTGIEYLMLGSTAANVVRNVKSPVLTVNPRATEESGGEK